MATKTTSNRKKSNQQFANSRFSRPGLIAFALAFAAIGTYLLLRSFAVPAPPTVYTTTPATFMATNTTFTVDVRENSGTTGVNAVQANLSFPASLLNVVSITDGNAPNPLNSPFGNVAQNTFSNTNGTISLAAGVGPCSSTCPSLTGDQIIARITFKTLTTGGTATVAYTSGTALVSSSTNADILGSLSATAGFTTTVDTTPPTVSITAPTNGSSIGAGTTVNVTATATDNNAISSAGVSFYVDGSSSAAATDTTAPYSFSWNTTGLSLGSHTLQAKATDPTGNLGTSSLITVTLVDSTPPTVSITAPTSGSTVKGTISVNTTAADNVAVAKVELYVDNVLKATDTTSPYNFSLDTTTLSAGSHSITAKAYDTAATANITTSTAVSITVDNSPPTTPGSFTTSNITFNSITLSWAAATDNVGVTGYQLSRNGTVITTTNGTTLSFVDSGLSPSTTYNYSLSALDAAGNASATAATVSAATLTQKPGDINLDNKVDITDLSTLLTNWNTTNASCDLNHNGVVDIFDLSILLSHYGT